MKRMINASSSSRAHLYIEYIDSDYVMGELGVHKAVIERNTLEEALLVLVDNIDFRDSDIDDMIESEGFFDCNELIERIQYINGDQNDADYLLYFENKSTGEIYIDNNYPEEEW